MQKSSARDLFNEAVNSLNVAQKEAVATIDGPVMVIAGPGTGKTQILTLRIANILLQTDTAPESILALTFTESGAKAMRERLHRYIGSESYRVAIHTFHGFAEHLIHDYPDSFGRIIGGRPVSALEKVHYLETILNGGTIKLLRPSGDPSYYVPHIIQILGQLKQEYITPDALANMITTQEQHLATTEQYHEKGAHRGKVRGEYKKLEGVIAKNHELLFVYRAYEALLAIDRRYDFEDMITETVRALSNDESLLRDLQERYQYILADEHQDVNGAQSRILELLSSYHERPNIFVVGDEKQAIYRFQGASLDNFLYFQDHFTDTKVIQLTDNYRSGQTILDVAHSLVAVEAGPLQALRLPLKAHAVSESRVMKATFTHQAVEDDALVKAVVAELAAGVPANEIAVIVRTNREVESLGALLRKAGVPVATSADSDILRHPITQAIEALLAVVVSPHTENALFTVLHGAYWGLSLTDVMKIMAARSYDLPLLTILADEMKLKELGVEHIEAARRIVTTIETARAKEVSEPPHRVFEYLVTDSGFLDHLMIHDPYEGARVLRRLYDEVEALVLRDSVGTLQDIVTMVASLKAYSLPLTAPYIALGEVAVSVITAHKSKGLEFSSVYIPHVQDAQWGGSVKRTYFTIPLPRLVASEIDDVIDDERRLLYVAMTRAKKTLVLSYSEMNTDGKPLLPSRLFDTVASSLIVPLDTTTAHTTFNPVASVRPTLPIDVVKSGVLLRALTTRGFSATSLNNYLKNPWNYLYRNVLRIPEVQPTHMQFGTAMHSVLEFATAEYTKTGTIPNHTALKGQLEVALGRLPLSPVEFTRLLEKGLASMAVYIDQVRASLPPVTKEEFHIRVLFETGLPELPLLPLTGKLDRLDLDSRGQAFRVIDYKTGQPKTRNEIEGKTANGDGAYKRQLIFYTLLLELHDDERYLTNEGVLSFVEPDKKGSIHEEAFTITAMEVTTLKHDIVTAVSAILRADFLTDAALAADSSYAHLAQNFLSHKQP